MHTSPTYRLFDRLVSMGTHIFRWLLPISFFSFLIVGLVGCILIEKPCSSDQECQDKNKPQYCVSGKCKECKVDDHCPSKECQNGVCSPMEESLSEPSAEKMEEYGVPESTNESAHDGDAESIPESNLEPQPEPVTEATCSSGTTRPCYPSGKNGCISDATGKYVCKGICAAGKESCVSEVWSGQCVGSTEPSNETCNGKDDDCDGQIDNQCGFFWASSAGGKTDDYGSSIVIDHFENVYIAGHYTGTATFGTTTLTSKGYSDIFVAKLDNQGSFRWASSAGGTNYDLADSIVVDSTGNLYVTGTVSESAIFGTNTLISKYKTVFVTKLDNQGNFLWVSSAGSTRAIYGNAIVTDNTSNLYIIGYYIGIGSFGTTTLTSKESSNMYVAKLNNQGNFLWATSAGSSTDSGVGTGITVDSSGNIYIIGYYGGISAFGTTTLTSKGRSDIFVAKLGNQGIFQWISSAGGISDDYGYGITTDSLGNLYITGSYRETAVFGATTLTSQGGENIFVAKLNNQGSFQWASSAGGKNGILAHSIAADSAGDLYITGQFYVTSIFGKTTLSSKGDRDLFVAKLDNQGSFQWASSAGGTGIDGGKSISVDSAGNLYITGGFGKTASWGPTTLTSRGDLDIFVAKLR